MVKKAGVLGIVLLCCGMAWTAENSGSDAVHRLSWAVGYDEGLAGKLFFTDKISANIGVGYMLTGADAPYEQPENELLLKVGGSYSLKEFRQLRINAFLEFAETMKQGQVAYTLDEVPNMRYNRWTSKIRIGLAPEFFIADHFSFTYKFGLQVAFIGDTYKLNADESGTETNDDNHIQFGVYGFDKELPFMLHNIAVMFYF